MTNIAEPMARWASNISRIAPRPRETLIEAAQSLGIPFNPDFDAMNPAKARE
jgi:hypothetical protein